MSRLVDVRGVVFGGQFVVIAGPCSVENEDQIDVIAKAVKLSGAHMLRGGVFKPRTSPYSFQGLGEIGLRFLRNAGDKYSLPIITEVLDPREFELIGHFTDMVQIGSRNMQNYPLLEEIGRSKIPVLLKRGMNSTVDEWLKSAEYIESFGNKYIVLCERGIRTFETRTRNTLDLSSIPLVKGLSDYPVITDPSHGTGVARLVAPLSFASKAVGADGVMIEVHPNPDKALSDGAQALKIEELGELVFKVGKLFAHTTSVRGSEPA